MLLGTATNKQATAPALPADNKNSGGLLGRKDGLAHVSNGRTSVPSFRDPSVADGLQAFHLRPEGSRDSLAFFVGPDEGRVWAIFDALVDRRLATGEHDVGLCHTVFAHARFHRQPGIIRNNVIEIPALPVLVDLLRHGNLHV